MITFFPNLTKARRLPTLPVIGSPNFVACTPAYMRAHGSTTQRALLNTIEPLIEVPDGYTVTVTSKLAYAHAGLRMTLARPGWHWDGFSHDDTGRPDFGSLDPKVMHYVANMVADPEHGPVASTEVAIQMLSIPNVGNPYQELADAARGVQTLEFEANTLYAFDQQTVHRAGYARRAGWRMFLRVSVSRREPVEQVDTSPVQVYADLDAATHGS